MRSTHFALQPALGGSLQARPLPPRFRTQRLSQPTTRHDTHHTADHTRTHVIPSSAASTSAEAGASTSASASTPQTQIPAAAPRRVAVFVEPSPFTYVCGYKNRFQSMIRYLVEQGCEVLVVTTGQGITLPGGDASAFRPQPEDFYGAKVIGSYSFGCPFYWAMPLTFALSPRIWKEVSDFKPDLIHCSSPGLMCLATWIFSRLLRIPLAFSYHTHIPHYLANGYGLAWLVPAMWFVLRVFHAAAHLTLTTSAVLREELATNYVARGRHLDVWKRGVDSDVFHPSYRDAAMRERLSEGDPSAPLMVYCGRLGLEKNLKFIKGIMDRVPGVRMAFVGDGPARKELEELFRGTGRVCFAGMMHGEDLSRAYASADIFIMPSESETLGFVVLEAMASGLPVVSVRAGGIPDILDKDGTTGFLYNPGDIDAAASLVQSLVNDAALRRKVGQAAREEVRRFDWHAATEHLLTVQYPMAVLAARAAYGAKFGRPVFGGPTAGVAEALEAEERGATWGKGGVRAAGQRAQPREEETEGALGTATAVPAIASAAASSAAA